MYQSMAIVDRINGKIYYSGIPFDEYDGHYGIDLVFNNPIGKLRTLNSFTRD
ncbi:hypothetical protein BH11BAC7_BH11BAC7_17040 [soil metagenome]